MYPESFDERKADSRWRVFWTTTVQSFRGFAFRVFLICILLFGFVGVRNHGVSVDAVLTALMYSGLILVGLFIICIGVGLQTAIVYRKDGSYNEK